jgi:DNA-binding IclR family transcriptional regulator
MEEPASLRGSQAILRALSVLDSFSGLRSQMSITEIAGATGLSVPTAHRIVKALESQHYLAREPQKKTYTLGSSILRLAGAIAERHDETAEIAAALVRIRDATGETVSFHRRLGDRRVCIAEEVSRQPIRIISGVGQSYPLTAGAAGKAILSVLPRTEVERLLDLKAVEPGARPLPRAKLLKSIVTARERGWAMSEGETVPGAAAIALPVEQSDQLTPCAINLVAPRDRMTPALIEEGVEVIRAEIKGFS